MCPERTHPYDDKHAFSFLSLLLRKGFQDRFTLTCSYADPFEGIIETCINRFTELIRARHVFETEFSLATLAMYANGNNYRRCVLDVRYHAHTGFQIYQLTIYSPALRQARVIPISQNDDLPFLRHIREAPLRFTRWPLRVTTWLILFISKIFR